MPDVVITIPSYLSLEDWINDEDAHEVPRNKREHAILVYGTLPEIRPSNRLYVVYQGKLRGHLRLVRYEEIENRAHTTFYGRFALIARGKLTPLTIPERIQGFPRWRYRWWSRKDERPVHAR